LVLLRKLVSM